MGNISRLFLIAFLALAMSPIAPEIAAGQGKPTLYVRFEHAGKVGYGILERGTIRVLDGNFLNGAKPTGATVAAGRVRLLAPVIPTKIIGVALNYASHGGSPVETPGIFAKMPSSIIGPGDAIEIPKDSQSLHYEGELVVVIGKRARKVSVEDAPNYVFGVSAGNDVTERSYPFGAFHVIRSKGSDTFAPLGPAVATGLNYNALKLQTRLNGKTVQSGTSANMITPVAHLVSFISRYITLERGDLIYTGTIGTTSAMKPGDVVEIEIEGVGILRNIVKAAGK